MEVIAAWFSFLVCFGVGHLLCFFSLLISCRDWQPMTHLHSQRSIARKPAYSSSSPSCALITQNSPHSNPVSKAILKAPGKSKAGQLLLMSVDIAIIEALKSDIQSTLFSWVTPAVQGKAVVSGPGENYVQSGQNDRNKMISAAFLEFTYRKPNWQAHEAPSSFPCPGRKPLWFIFW